MSNPLVPESRINKNGVPVIKHVRASGSAASTSKVPPPTVSASAPKVPRGKDICEVLQKASGPHGSNFGVGNMDKVNELSDERRTKLMEMVQSEDKDAVKILGLSIQYDGSQLLEAVMEVHEFALKVFRAKDESASVIRTHKAIESIFRGENNYGYEMGLDEENVNDIKSKLLTKVLGIEGSYALEQMLDPDDYALELSEDLDLLEPALPAIMALKQVGHRAPTTGMLLDLAELVSEHPGRVDDIASTILSRNSGDLEMLRDVLESDAFALSDGVL